jgi:hypothetical protein
MSVLRIENVRGELLAEVIWTHDGPRVMSATDVVRRELEEIIHRLFSGSAFMRSGAVREGQFVTTQVVGNTASEDGLTVLADLLVRQKIALGGQRVIPNGERLL